jgi:hypothetical protein
LGSDLLQSVLTDETASRYLHLLWSLHQTSEHLQLSHPESKDISERNLEWHKSHPEDRHDSTLDEIKKQVAIASVALENSFPLDDVVEINKSFARDEKYVQQRNSTKYVVVNVHSLFKSYETTSYVLKVRGKSRPLRHDFLLQQGSLVPVPRHQQSEYCITEKHIEEL